MKAKIAKPSVRRPGAVVTIDPDVHSAIVEYCHKEGLLIGPYASRVLKQAVESKVAKDQA